MSHPDPLYDPENSYETDEEFMAANPNYDDHDDFYEDENSGEVDWYDEDDDSMDGDAESAFGSCGWGVNEQYSSDYDSGDDW